MVQNFIEIVTIFRSDLTARLSWINWENLGVHPGRRTLLTSLALGSETNCLGLPNH
jgi:hypothetical protein